MATSYHAFGAGVIQLNTGANSAMETLGLTEEGAQIEVTHEVHEIKSDAGGDRVPVEFQAMGSRARITAPVIAWDDAVLAKAVYKSEGGSAEGTAVAAGALLGTGGFLFQLYMASSTDNPWLFYYVRLANSGHDPGTKSKPRRLVFDAIRFVAGTATSVSGVKLYQRAAPP